MVHGGFYEAALPETATAVVNHRLLPGAHTHTHTHREREREREANIYIYMCVCVYIYIGDTAAKMLERDTRKVRDSLPSDLQDLCHVQRKEDSTVQDASPVSSSHTLGFAIVAGALRATFGADLVISGFFRVAGGLFVAASGSKDYNLVQL